MPEMRQVAAAVDSYMLPSSGVQITMRRHLTGQDRADARAVAVALRKQGFEEPQIYTRYLCTLAASLITRWTATDAEDEPLPISPQQLGKMESELDFWFLLDLVVPKLEEREDDPEKEGPFEPPSTQSSEGTSSKTPQSSPTS